jgi:hypothetical protein
LNLFSGSPSRRSKKMTAPEIRDLRDWRGVDQKLRNQLFEFGDAEMLAMVTF